ncbi:MAG: phage tail tape measure protein, partial [Acetivibrionales bacterium]
MAREIKTVFALDGETRYRDAIKGINREMALLRAEMRASDNAFDTSGDKQQKLSTRAESLARQIELQKKKVEEAQNAVEQANRRYEEASAKLEEMRAAGKESTDEFKKQQQEVERAEKALTDYKIDVANAESSLGKMQTQLANTNKEILLNESRLKKAGTAMEASAKKAEKVGKTLTNAGNKLTTGLTLPIVAVGAASIKAAIDFESAFAGVRKTVDGTEEQMAALEQGIRDMAKEIPATTTEISAVAEAAGQLGIETDSVLAFTRVMIDLGETTNLSAEEGAAALAKFANVTQMSQDDFDRLGSVIVALGNNMATTEADIVAMGTRLAGAGRQVGMTEPQIMSFAAALSSVGIEAEAGGSAFSKVMVEIQLASEKGGAKLKQFA